MRGSRRNTAPYHFPAKEFGRNYSDFRNQTRRHSGLKYVRRNNRRAGQVTLLRFTRILKSKLRCRLQNGEDLGAGFDKVSGGVLSLDYGYNRVTYTWDIRFSFMRHLV